MLTLKRTRKNNPAVGDKIEITKITANFTRNQFIGKIGKIIEIHKTNLGSPKNLVYMTTITSEYLFYKTELRLVK